MQWDKIHCKTRGVSCQRRDRAGGVGVRAESEAEAVGQIVAELDELGLPVKRYLWGADVDQLLAEETVDLANRSAAGEVAWPLAEHQGTIRDWATQDGGITSVEDHVKYDPFGNIDPTDVEAAAGRWLSEDPIGFEAGDVNLYRYCGNDAVNGVDPSGLDYIVEQYFMFGEIPMRHLYLVVETLWVDHPPVYIGMEDPTGLVWRPYTQGPDRIGTPGDWRSWYKGLEAKAYVVSRAEVDAEWNWSWQTSDWDKWFKNKDAEQKKHKTWVRMRLNSKEREDVLMGVYAHSADHYNRRARLRAEIPWLALDAAFMYAEYAGAFIRVTAALRNGIGTTRVPALQHNSTSSSSAVSKGTTAARQVARVDDTAAELAAQRRLMDMTADTAPGRRMVQLPNGTWASRRIGRAHYLGKHSPAVSDQALIARATTGRDPWTGQIVRYAKGPKQGLPILVDSTKFCSYQDMLESIEKAIRSFDAAYPNQEAIREAIKAGRFKDTVVVDMCRSVGYGFAKATGVRRAGLHQVKVYFDVYWTGR